jgi:uncharacterized membrane protein YqgA involved in biofilm formation
VLGEAARIDDGLTTLGDLAERAVGANRASSAPGRTEVGSLFSKGFVTASLAFCVGPRSILGSLQDGLTGAYDTLAVKSMPDGFTAVALASSLRWGVVFSSLTVLIYQGALTFGAG